MYSYPAWPQIVYRQRKWVHSRGMKLDSEGKTLTLEENLFHPLNAETRAEFQASGGNELGRIGSPGKMQAPWSSSALVCNVFDYWRSQFLLGESLAVLTNALGAPSSVKQMQFEQTYRTGFGGTPPRLNVILRADESTPFLIKAKFTQPYGGGSTRDAFAKSYFPNSGEYWGKYGLSRCENLARRIHANQEEFRYLNAPQLLNKILGMVNTFQKKFTLLYLWCDFPSYDAERHRAEVETFMLRLNGEIDFRAMTYQELFEKIRIAPDVDEKYIAYLAERYFPEQRRTKEKRG